MKRFKQGTQFAMCCNYCSQLRQLQVLDVQVVRCELREPLRLRCMSPANRVTIPELAEELGLSVGTVSGALNGKPTVAAATRERVLDLARQRGFRFNTAARSLRQGRPQTFALHVPLAARTLSYYMRFAIGFADAASTHEIDVILAASNAAGRGEAFRVDGAAVADWEAGPNGVAELVRARVPVVAADGVPPGAPMPAAVLQVDYELQLRRILRSAHAGGASRVMVVAPDHSLESRWSLDVVEGCTAINAELGMMTQTVGFPIFGKAEELVELVRERLAHPERPDCIVFAGQNLAGYAANGLQLGTPESAVPWVASCAGDEITEVGASNITAIHSDSAAMGARCAQLLVELVDDPSAVDTTRVEAWPSTVSFADHWPQVDA